MTARTTSSTSTVSVVVALAVDRLSEPIKHDLLHSGLTILLVRFVLLIPNPIRWLQESVSLISGWVLEGFGQGLVYVGILLTSTLDEAVLSERLNWFLLPAGLLLCMGGDPRGGRRDRSGASLEHHGASHPFAGAHMLPGRVAAPGTGRGRE